MTPALRQLARNPAFTAAAVLTLALGVGLVTTQYALIEAVLLRRLPYPDAGRLFHVGRLPNGREGGSWQPIPARDYLAFRDQTRVFETLAGFHTDNLNLSRAGAPPRRLRGRLVTPSFFPLLRQRPQLGPALEPGDDRVEAPLKAVIGHALWQEEFGGDPTVIGHPIRINGEPGVIAGVMPPGFAFPGRDECWVNLRLSDTPSDPARQPGLEVLGLLRPGVTPREAAAALEVIHQRMLPAAPADDREPRRFAVQPVPLAYTGSGTVPLLNTMLAMTVLVLVLAAGNVAGLLHVRSDARQRELAVRAALGAGRGHLVRMLLLESVLLGILGAGLGLLLASLAIHFLDDHITSHLEVASWVRVEMNHRVAALAVGSALAAGLLAGIPPARRAARLPLVESLKQGGGGSVGAAGGRVARWLAVAQVAFASSLAIVAGLLALSATRSSRINLPYQPDSLLIGRLELQGAPYRDPADRTRFYRQLLDQVRQTPGVAAAAVSSRDLVNPGVYTSYEIEGTTYPRPSDRPSGFLEVVSRDYLAVIGKRPADGRFFDGSDSGESRPVAVVNQSFARRHWPGSSPLGRRLRRAEPDAPWATIIGVVPDLNLEGVGNNDPPAGWYLLQDQQGWGWLDLLVRVNGNPADMIAPVRRAVAALDPDQPVHTLTTLRERTDRRVAALEIVGTMAVVFAVVAVLMAGVGLHGVVAYGVRRRTRELGVRLALGASARGLQQMILREGALRFALGLVLGLAGGAALARPLAPYLPHVSPGDPQLHAGVALLICLVVALSLWLPARRAARIDPLTALQAD